MPKTHLHFHLDAEGARAFARQLLPHLCLIEDKLDNQGGMLDHIQCQLTEVLKAMSAQSEQIQELRTEFDALGVQLNDEGAALQTEIGEINAKIDELTGALNNPDPTVQGVIDDLRASQQAVAARAETIRNIIVATPLVPSVTPDAVSRGVAPRAGKR